MLSRSIPLRQAGLIIIALAVVQFSLQMSLLARGVEYAAVSLIIDDTYYYLQSAWNAKLLGFVTFDGLHATNGVQLLWFVMIFVLALLSSSKTVLLFATLTVSFLLNLLSYLTILKIGSILKQPVLALFLASLWALQSLPFRIYSMGMENSLHALIFWCTVWQSVEFILHIQNKERPNFGALTVVLILLVWTRLDSGLIAAVLFAFCVATLAYPYRHNLGSFFRTYGNAIAGSAFLAGLGLLVQLTSFRLMGGSFLPVSALVKTSGAGRGMDMTPMEKLTEVLLLGMPSILQGRFPTLALILLGLSGILLVILARVALRGRSDEMRAFLNLWSCLLVGELFYYFYVALSDVEYTPYFIWYRSPSFIFWIVTGSLIASFVFVESRPLKSLRSSLRWAPAGVSLAIFAVAIYLFGRSIDFRSELYAARYEAALWIAEHSSPNTVFASWNAGQLGFFSDRTFINLDGVINNVDYYERVLVGSTTLADYLLENNVDYIVDYSVYGSIPDFQVVHQFPIDDGTERSIQIWKVRPQASLDQ